MAVDWKYYDDKKFEVLDDLYLPTRGEAETKVIMACLIKNGAKFR